MAGRCLRSIACAAHWYREGMTSKFTNQFRWTGQYTWNSGATVNLDGVLVRYFSSNYLRRLSWAPLCACITEKIDRFDVVHIHTVFLWPTWATARPPKSSCAVFDLAERMLIKELIARRNRFIKSAWLKLIERPSFEQAAAVHVTSELEAKELSVLNGGCRMWWCF